MADVASTIWMERYAWKRAREASSNARLRSGALADDGGVLADRIYGTRVEVGQGDYERQRRCSGTARHPEVMGAIVELVDGGDIKITRVYALHVVEAYRARVPLVKESTVL